MAATLLCLTAYILFKFGNILLTQKLSHMGIVMIGVASRECLTSHYPIGIFKIFFS